jgi:hypothetical protein
MNMIGGMFKDEKKWNKLRKQFAFVVGCCAHLEILEFTAIRV